MPNTVISYPIPPYQNVPIHSEWYTPKRFVISDIGFQETDLGSITIVTTVGDQDFYIGQIVRLVIPSKYGCRLLNGRQGMVIFNEVSDEVVLDINPIGVDPFIPSPTFLPFQSRTPPQIMAIGDNNSGVINSHGRTQLGTFVPGSFRDISPL